LIRRIPINPLPRFAGPETVKARAARNKSLGGRPGKQGCMYHIWPPQCQIQLGRRERGDYADFASFRLRLSPQSSDFTHAVRCGIGSVQQGDDLFPRQRRFDFAEARDYPAGLAGDGQRVERGALKQAFGRIN
jgi:hypothetical protein